MYVGGLSILYGFETICHVERIDYINHLIFTLCSFRTTYSVEQRNDGTIKLGPLKLAKSISADVLFD